MDVMAKKKPKPPRGRARETGKSRAVNFEFTVALDEALDTCAESEDRTRTAVLVRALKAYLTAAGLWPPDQDQADE